MSAHKFVQVEVVKPHDGHNKGARFALREDVADQQAGFGWVKKLKGKAADAEDGHGIQGGPGTGSEASDAGGPEDSGQAG